MSDATVLVLVGGALYLGLMIVASNLKEVGRKIDRAAREADWYRKRQDSQVNAIREGILCIADAQLRKRDREERKEPAP